MPDKLIDGNITIEDKASRGLTQIEKKLIDVAKLGNSATDAIERLGKAVRNFRKRNETNFLSGGYIKSKSGLDIAIPKRGGKKFDVDYEQFVRQSGKAKSLTAKYVYDPVAGPYRFWTDKELMRNGASGHKSIISRLTASASSVNPLVDKQLLRIHMKGNKFAGRTSPISDVFGLGLGVEAPKVKGPGLGARAHEAFSNKLSKVFTPKLKATFAESFRGALDNSGLVRSSLGGKGLGGSFGGAIGGRMFGNLIGKPVLGTLAGGFVKGGLIGLGVGAAISGVMEGIDKLTDYVGDILETVRTIAQERATESTSLRRKMQMSSEMFGVNPRDVVEIDEKIYALRGMEQEYYKKGLPGREITTSAIDWLHLLGTKETGGTFANEQQAFDFSEALSAIAKMNGLSDAEFETVRYQGMQILSKGYADILDIKPLLNSAPGFVRDLLRQTGMSRSEFLESGRTRSFTSDKFIDALMGVKDYYKILAERMSSRTPEQQEEAAENIIGAAAIWDEMYIKAKAESNSRVANAVIEGGLISDIKESWYQMWTTTNDARDGVLKKATFEKKITNDILKGVLYIYGVFVTLKNTVDIIVGSVMWVMGHIGVTIMNVFDLIANGLLGLFGELFTYLGEKTHNDTLKEWGEALNPNSKTNKEKRMKEDFADTFVDTMLKEQERGANYVESKYGYILDQKSAQDVVTGNIEEVIHHPATYRTDEFGVRELATMAYDEVVSKPHYGYTTTANLMDTILYGNNPEDKRVGRFQDRSKMKEAVLANIGAFMDESGNWKSGYSNFSTHANQSLVESAVSSAATHRSLVEDFGLKHENVEDYTWQNVLKDRRDFVNNAFVNSTKNDINDIKRTWDNINKTVEEATKAFENMKDPYLDNLGKDVKDIKEGKGKGSSEILDVLKEIAGVVVINKVTKVRPDVVFNYGSYGRNGSNEDPNLLRTGDARASLVNELNNAMAAAMAYLDDDRIESDIGGVIVLDSAAV